MVSSVGGQQTKGAPDFIRKATKFPRFKPYFIGMIVDHEGNILIQTFESDKDKIVYDIFDSDGNFIIADGWQSKQCLFLDRIVALFVN